MKKPVRFGKYFLLERINVGGMAEVFKAKSFGVEGFEKLIAIKRILPSIAEDEDFITMFIDEAKIAVQLNHANIAQIFDLGKIDDSYFIALEYVHGKDLRTIWDRHKRRGLRLPIPLSVYIMTRVCEGLDYAHRKKNASGHDLNIVHRDVSPQNMLISYEGECKIIDFGIAKAANKASKTQAGILKGKFGYMSPEQVRGLPLDRRADIFSAGIILYEMLTGERLFVGESDFSTLEKVRNVEILPPTTYNRKIPDTLEKIVLKALSKDPEDRFQSAYDMQEELQRFLITSRANFARKDLAAYMKRAFRLDIEREAERHKKYEALATPSLDDSVRTAEFSSFGGNPAVSAGPSAPSRSGGMPTLQDDDDDDIETVVFDARAGLPDDVPTDPSEVSSEPSRPVPPPFPAGPPSTPAESVFDSVPDVDAELETSTETDRPEFPGLAPEALSTLDAPVADFRVEEFSTGETTLAGTDPAVRKPRSMINIVIAVLAVIAVGVFGFAVFKYMQRQGMLGGTTTLSIQTTPPDAEILLDGKVVTSPVADVEAGKHIIEARADNYQPYREEIDVQGGNEQVVAISMTFIPASLEVTVEPPDTVVKMDGKQVGDQSPIKLDDILPGKSHEFSFEHAKFSTEKQSWEFKPREKRQEKVVLKEKSFDLDVKSTPTGARITLDGSAQGRTPKVVKGLKASKHYKLEVKHPRFPVWSTTIFYDGYPTREVKVHLDSAAKKPAGIAPPPPEPKRLPRPTQRPKRAEVKKPPAVAPGTRPEVEPAPEVAPEPRPAPKPAPKPAAKGSLRLNSKPWGKVWIDGKDIGQNTPLLDYPLPAGKHKITIQFSTGEQKSDFIEIKAGETTTKVIRR